MTDRYEIDFSDDPVFETVTGLTNTTFNINNITENRMATEGQLLTIANRINDLQNRINYCCNDIVTWKTYVRVIAERTSTVVRDWDRYVVVGTTRKNNPFTVEFGLPFNTESFYPNLSIYHRGSSVLRYPMHIKVNITGRASLCESSLISDGMNMDIDYTMGVTPEGRRRIPFAPNIAENGNASFFPAYGVSPSNPNGDSLTMNILPYTSNVPETEVENNPFPIMSLDGKYRVYLDGGKVKVDVITKSHFAENDYVASFFIQYVLRAGVSL